MTPASYRVAILSHRDREAKEAAAPESGRFAKVFQALSTECARAVAVLYHDNCREEVRRQLLQVDGVLVWVNPEEGGCDRSLLDALLREVASLGIFVSAHPDVILKIGTKEVLYQTRDMGWGCDTALYRNMEALRRELPMRLALGQERVLKQYRGHGGDGVWKVRQAAGTFVRVRHAKRGCVEELIPLHELFERCESYFSGDGRMIDQAYQPRLTEGMIRCYLVRDEVRGFGHQAINALYPTPAGVPPTAAPTPSPRLYYPATMPPFQALKHRLERDWVAELQRLLQIRTDELPVLWDCDFLLGAKTASGEDTYILCEINASSVSPFPDSAATFVARAALAGIRASRRGSSR
jgi:hypothetical protein